MNKIVFENLFISTEFFVVGYKKFACYLRNFLFDSQEISLILIEYGTSLLWVSFVILRLFLIIMSSTKLFLNFAHLKKNYFIIRPIIFFIQIFE